MLRRLIRLAIIVWVGRWLAGEIAAWLVGRRPPHEAYRR